MITPTAESLKWVELSTICNELPFRVRTINIINRYFESIGTPNPRVRDLFDVKIEQLRLQMGWGKTTEVGFINVMRAIDRLNPNKNIGTSRNEIALQVLLTLIRSREMEAHEYADEACRITDEFVRRINA